MVAGNNLWDFSAPSPSCWFTCSCLERVSTGVCIEKCFGDGGKNVLVASFEQLICEVSQWNLFSASDERIVWHERLIERSRLRLVSFTLERIFQWIAAFQFRVTFVYLFLIPFSNSLAGGSKVKQVAFPFISSLTQWAPQEAKSSLSSSHLLLLAQLNGLRMKNCVLHVAVLLAQELGTEKVNENENSHVGHYVSAGRRHQNDLLSLKNFLNFSWFVVSVTALSKIK